MVICWIMGSVSESIAKSIMFVGTASEIWSQLERRFSLSDGSRKYKLNKDTYAIAQSGGSVGEYYTKMKCVWEELDNLNVLPVINSVTPEVSLFLAALNKQREEQRLFQFLNGLDECYSHQRSQILMIVPLPNVESACSLVQQEESQRMLFGSSSLESTALFSKGHVKDGVKDGKCSICGFKWHPPERCWEKVGYPSWHPKSKLSQSKQTNPGQVQGRNQFVARTAAHVESGNISFTPQQFEQLLKSVQQMTAFNSAEEEIDHQFVADTFNSSNKQTVSSYGLWHHRLGHVSDSKLKYMNDLPDSVSKSSDICLSCPLAIFTKFPYTKSDSHSSTSNKYCDEFDSFQGPNVPPQTIPEPVQVTHNTVPEDVNSQSTNSSVLPQSQAPTRKSTRTTTVPSKLKDCVLSHVPKANQESQTPLIPDFQDFICALTELGWVSGSLGHL
ncbi:hypothetical protein CTI12_AA224970 [Artemisia annua]|uniref:GAG-pre-integrase domain-containing protein n=1 Tax=Artemisia annua TaxID=35608 RepID=A0A2U1MES2_ARTAN|nr:hypothetical protein CTI12_AA224970 [Artemisia annua]